MSAADVAQPVAHMNGNGELHGNGYEGHREPKFASGLILPPPEIKCEFAAPLTHDVRC